MVVGGGGGGGGTTVTGGGENSKVTRGSTRCERTRNSGERTYEGYEETLAAFVLVLALVRYM